MEQASRLTKEQYCVEVCKVVSQRASCVRRKVGAVLVNRHFHILATGYNGPPRGIPNCIDVSCEGAKYKSGEGLDKCIAVHAEQNALLQCVNTEEIYACFVTTSPCITCVKMLLNTGCQRIIFTDEYPHQESKLLWEKAGRTWEKAKR